MRYQRTQVYLEPEDHRALTKEAQRRGISLAALLREIVSQYRADAGGAAAKKTFDELMGVVQGGPATDIVGEQELYKREAAERLHARKLGGRSSRVRRT